MRREQAVERRPQLGRGGQPGYLLGVRGSFALERFDHGLEALEQCHVPRADAAADRKVLPDEEGDPQYGQHEQYSQNDAHTALLNAWS